MLSRKSSRAAAQGNPSPRKSSQTKTQPQQERNSAFRKASADPRRCKDKTDRDPNPQRVKVGATRTSKSRRPSLFADWDRGPFYLYNGADQLTLYGRRYFFLAAVAFLFGLICAAMDFLA